MVFPVMKNNAQVGYKWLLHLGLICFIALFANYRLFAADIANETELKTALLDTGVQTITSTASAIPLTGALALANRPKTISGLLSGSNPGTTITTASGQRLLAITGSGTSPINFSNLILKRPDTVQFSGNGGGVSVTGAVTMNITNTWFQGFDVSGSGAALYTSAGMTGNIANSVFSGNHAHVYGAVNINGDYTGTVSFSQFTNNTADNYLTVVSTTPGSAALDVRGTFTGNIEDSTFLNNVSQGNEGGALRVASSSGSKNFVGNIVRSTFTGNSAKSSGGAILISGSLMGAITDSTFTYNTGGSGGVLLTGQITGGISGSTFSYNTAGQAGALFLSGAIGNGITNSTFVGNTTTGVGSNGDAGALYAVGGINGGVTNCLFDDNHAVGTGGALFALSINGGMSGTTFTNNSANRGGALVIYGGMDTPITTTLFDNNSATLNGGALYIDHGAMAITDPTFTNNTAGGFGGGIYSQGALTLAATDGSSIFSGNTAGGGSSAVHLGIASTYTGSLAVNTATGAVLDMRDAVTGAATAGKEIAVVKTGAGTWKLGGDSAFTSTDATAKNTFSVQAGELYLYGDGEAANPNPGDGLAMVEDGVVTLAGSGSTFTLGGGAVLTAGGDNSVSAGGQVLLKDGSVLQAGAAAVTSLALSGGAGVGVEGTLGVNVSGAAQILNLDAALAETTAGSGVFSKTGDGGVNLVQADALSGLSTVSVQAGGVRSGQDQYFKNLQAAAGTVVDLGAADLTLDAGTLKGQVSANNLTKNGTGSLELYGQVALTGTFDMDAGVLDMHIPATTGPMMTADNVTFGANTTLNVLGFSGSGLGDTYTLIQTTQTLNPLDLPTNHTIASTVSANLDFIDAQIVVNPNSIDAVVGLAWYDQTTDISGKYCEAHGTFTLDAAAPYFELGTVLADRTGDQFTHPWDGACLTKEGAGTLALLAVNTYSGDSTVNAGTLAAMTEGALGTSTAVINSAGTLLVAHDGTFANDVQGTGTMETRGTLYATGDMSAHAGGVIVAENSLGLGLVGGPAVTSGALFTVKNGATLLGNGVIGGLLVESGGTLSPGHSIGTITVNGNAVFQSGSFFNVEFDPADPMQADLLAVTGTVDLGGATVRLVDMAQYGPSVTPGQWTIVSAAGGYGASRFDSQVENQYVFLTASLAYPNPNDVVLVIGRNAANFSDFAATPNQIAVAGGLDSLAPGDSLYDDVIALPAGTDMADLYDHLSGEMHPGLRSMLQDSDRAFGQTMLNRFIYAAPPVECGLPVWIESEGDTAWRNGDRNLAKAKYYGMNFSIGAEKCFTGNWLLGGAFRYGRHDYKVDARDSRADIDSYTFGLYGGKEVALSPGLLRLALGASYGWHDVDSRRTITTPGMQQRLKAGYHAQTAQIVADAGFRINPIGALALEPFARLGWNSVWSGSFTESGGNAALRSGREHQGNLSQVFGVRAGAALSKRATLTAAAGWAHAYGNTCASNRFVFAEGGDAFSVQGVPIARDAAYLSAGVEVKITARWTARLEYEGYLGGKAQRHGGSAMLQCSF